MMNNSAILQCSSPVLRDFQAAENFGQLDENGNPIDALDEAQLVDQYGDDEDISTEDEGGYAWI